MFYHTAIMFFWLFATLLAANAHILSTTPMPTTKVSVTNAQLGAIVTPALAPHHYDLQLREEHGDNICGHNDQLQSYVPCPNPNDRCTNTIIWKDQTYDAYMYCWPSDLSTTTPDYIWTTAVGSWDAGQPCGLSTVCWYVSE